MICIIQLFTIFLIIFLLLYLIEINTFDLLFLLKLMFNDREVANNNAGGRRISTQSKLLLILERADSLSLAWNV